MTTQSVRIVRTTQEIRNPKPDGRRDGWTYAKTVPAGSRFIVNDHEDRTLARVRQVGVLSYSESTLTCTPLGKLVLAHSEPVEPETWQEMAAIAGCDGWSEGEYLRILVKLGLIGLSDFHAVAALDEGE